MSSEPFIQFKQVDVAPVNEPVLHLLQLLFSRPLCNGHERICLTIFSIKSIFGSLILNAAVHTDSVISQHKTTAFIFSHHA